MDSAAMIGVTVRGMAKRVAHAGALVAISPLLAMYYMHFCLARRRRDEAIQGYSQFFALIPGAAGVILRRAFYSVVLDRCGKDCSLGFGTLVVTPHVRIGEGTYIGVYCNISHCAIGSDVLIGSYVELIAGKHIHDFTRLDVPIRHQGGTITPLVIGEDVWIGNGALVLANVGAHAVIAAGAVVVHDVEPYSIVGGNPARVLATRESLVTSALPPQ
jgi:acetyltransferase-like isoleucine patch superfamily enzyme